MNSEKLWKTALILSFITIFYNIAEGIVSLVYGIGDETLSLMGFGIDSFVEVVSGIGVAHMILRIRKSADDTETPRFERNALRLTGSVFYLLSVGLIAGVVISIVQGSRPVTTIPGIVISLISLASMFILMRYKMITGKALKSNPIIADARCTLTCIYLSVVLLTASILYELTKIPYIDAAGSLGIAFFSFREGREAFEKAGGKQCGCGGDSCENENE
ncbi:MAG: cation transporter [Brevinematales bacterium]|nr:cation transporter [Brevinematales bacterium]